MKNLLKVLLLTIFTLSCVSFSNAQQSINQSFSGSSTSAVALPSFAPLIKQTIPAVVNISTTQNVEVKNNPLDGFKFNFPDSPEMDLFKEYFDREYGQSEPRTRKATSLGSGFIIDPTGFVVTNNHVIAEADEINVVITENDEEKTYHAKLIGTDPKTDLALLKIESTKPFPFLKFGDSDKSLVGDWVITIGNPFGLGNTVTAGIISAKSRFIAGQYDEFIQTDASINKGNSGGPMINLNGEVIGVNSVIISPSGGNVGIGLSIPTNLANPIIKQLREKGLVTRGWLGVKIQPVTEDIAKNLGLSEAKGALVAEITKDSPADKAGFKIGDVITKFDEKAINNMQKLPRFVAETEIGRKVNSEVVRDGKVIIVPVTVEKSLDTDAATEKKNAKKQTQEDSASQGGSNVLGMRVEEISPAIRNKFKLDKSAAGLIVTKVNRNTPASDAGIRVGDIILRFNKQNVSKITELDALVKDAQKAKSKNAVMLINRANSNQFVIIYLE